ncbi:MAG: IS256 family transposase [Actinomycetales bacterium]|nr:IS256 family transposase [Actinomycetales bacterium]
MSVMNTRDEYGLEGVVPGSARELRRAMVSDALLDEVIAQAGDQGITLTGDGGLLPELVKAVLERGLAVELDDHLGYVKGDPAGRGSPNSRNGFTPKTVGTEVGPVPLDVPRDRQGSFEPRLVPKGARRLDGLDEMIVSLYAGGMTIRDIQHHLACTIGTELSPETISNITDAVLDEVMAWQTRPLDAIYPVVFMDALVVKVKENNTVRNKAAHIAVGVDCQGVKHVLGIWVQQTEGAKFWATVCAELANRGVRDIVIACVDGLTGFAEAIEATWPKTVVQTCVVHLIRASMRFVSYKDRRAVAAGLKHIYTAVNEDTAMSALEAFEACEMGRKYPATATTWRAAWDRFIPFLEFAPAVRKVIYTTNAIESLNYQLRKIIKNRGHFPNDTAVVKLLWLSIRNIEDKRARERAKAATKAEASPHGKLIEGTTTQGWSEALGALVIAFPERFAGHLN